MPILMKVMCPSCSELQDIVAVAYQCDLLYSCTCEACGFVFDDETDATDIVHNDQLTFTSI